MKSTIAKSGHILEMWYRSSLQERNSADSMHVICILYLMANKGAEFILLLFF